VICNIFHVNVICNILLYMVLYSQRTTPKGKKRNSGKDVASTTKNSPMKNTRSIRVKKAKIKKRLVLDL
jgi:hypothetical protein